MRPITPAIIARVEAHKAGDVEACIICGRSFGSCHHSGSDCHAVYNAVQNLTRAERMRIEQNS